MATATALFPTLEQSLRTGEKALRTGEQVSNRTNEERRSARRKSSLRDMPVRPSQDESNLRKDLSNGNQTSVEPQMRTPQPIEPAEQIERFRDEAEEDTSKSRGLSELLQVSIAMDLGTKNTLLYARKRGILLNEPSMVALEATTGKVVAVGQEAERLYGRNLNKYKCVRPLKDGVIANFDLTAIMIKEFLNRAVGKWRLTAPRLVIGVPSSITQVERRAVLEAANQSGVKRVHLIAESTAAAIGAGLPVERPFGSMVIDIGGGTSEVAILSMKGVVYSESIRVAGDHMDAAIQRHIRRKHQLMIGIQDAERLKVLIGSALPFRCEQTQEVSGRDVRTSLPTTVTISSQDVYEALEQPVGAMVSAVKTALESSSPEIANDIISEGIFLAGGGALLKGLGLRIEKETGIKVYRAQDPLSCVVRGAGKVVDRFAELKSLCISR